MCVCVVENVCLNFNYAMPIQLAVMATGIYLVRRVDIVRLEISVIKLQDIVHSVK